MSDVTAGERPDRQDSDRLARVYATYSVRLLGYVRARLGRYDWHFAEDLTQETFLRVARDLPSCRAGEESMFGWLATIARHTIADHYRLARHRRERPTDFTARAYVLPAVPSAEDVALARAAARELAVAA